jgi:hypothetical protein
MELHRVRSTRPGAKVLQIITAAEARGQARMAEMNRQVAGNLEKIITALGGGEAGTREAAADAG